jgi:hypothetical protein
MCWANGKVIAIPFGGEYGFSALVNSPSPQFAIRVFLGPETESLELNLDAHVGGDENTLKGDGILILYLSGTPIHSCVLLACWENSLQLDMATGPRSSWFSELVRSCLSLVPRSPPSSPPLSPHNANASNMIFPIASSPPDPLSSAEPVSAIVGPAPVNHSSDREAEAVENSAWEALKLGLRGLEGSLGIFPPLKAAVGGLVACVRHFEVSPESRYDQGDKSKEAMMYRRPNRTRRSMKNLLQIL